MAHHDINNLEVGDMTLIQVFLQIRVICCIPFFLYAITLVSAYGFDTQSIEMAGSVFFFQLMQAGAMFFCHCLTLVYTSAGFQLMSSCQLARTSR